MWDIQRRVRMLKKVLAQLDFEKGQFAQLRGKENVRGAYACDWAQVLVGDGPRFIHLSLSVEKTSIWKVVVNHVPVPSAFLYTSRGPRAAGDSLWNQARSRLQATKTNRKQ